MERKDRLEAIEILIDEGSVSEVMEEISAVCHLKAQHLQENWQDRNSAKVWITIARIIDKVIPKINQAGADYD